MPARRREVTGTGPAPPGIDEAALVKALKAGDEAAAQALWQRYFSSLVQLARTKLQGANRRVTDEEDVALSVFRKFFKSAEEFFVGTAYAQTLPSGIDLFYYHGDHLGSTNVITNENGLFRFLGIDPESGICVIWVRCRHVFLRSFQDLGSHSKSVSQSSRMLTIVQPRSGPMSPKSV